MVDGDNADLMKIATLLFRSKKVLFLSFSFLHVNSRKVVEKYSIWRERERLAVLNLAHEQAQLDSECV